MASRFSATIATKFRIAASWCRDHASICKAEERAEWLELAQLLDALANGVG